MATKRYTYEQVGPEFLESAPVKLLAVVVVDAPPEAVFRAMEREDAWKAALDLDVTWTSARPFGVGTTRTVRTSSGTELDEVFTAWDPGERMAFYMPGGSSRMFAAFYEDYALEPLDGGRCRLVWRVGIRMRGVAKLIGPLVKRALEKGAGGFARFAEFTG
jgi:hypothetical protein